MSLLSVPLIAFLSLFLVVLASVLFFISLHKLKNEINRLALQAQSSSLQIDELSISNIKLKNDFSEVSDTHNRMLLESIQVSKQLEHRIKVLQQQNIEQQQLFIQWQDEQGQDKFYNRAFKLAGKGAGIEEIMNECELPRAEVEMLLSVYQQRIAK